MTQQGLPQWAVQRVATVLQAERGTGQRTLNPADLARRTGLSKSLARRCQAHLTTASPATSGRETQEVQASPAQV
jgi:DNA-binding IclR family transcriptional regulator